MILEFLQLFAQLPVCFFFNAGSDFGIGAWCQELGSFILVLWRDFILLPFVVRLRGKAVLYQTVVSCFDFILCLAFIDCLHSSVSNRTVPMDVAAL